MLPGCGPATGQKTGFLDFITAKEPDRVEFLPLTSFDHNTVATVATHGEHQPHSRCVNLFLPCADQVMHAVAASTEAPGRGGSNDKPIVC